MFKAKRFLTDMEKNPHAYKKKGTDSQSISESMHESLVLLKSVNDRAMER